MRVGLVKIETLLRLVVSSSSIPTGRLVGRRFCAVRMYNNSNRPSLSILLYATGSRPRGGGKVSWVGFTDS